MRVGQDKRSEAVKSRDLKPRSRKIRVGQDERSEAVKSRDREREEWAKIRDRKPSKAAIEREKSGPR